MTFVLIALIVAVAAVAALYIHRRYPTMTILAGFDTAVTDLITAQQQYDAKIAAAAATAVKPVQDELDKLKADVGETLTAVQGQTATLLADSAPPAATQPQVDPNAGLPAV